MAEGCQRPAGVGRRHGRPDRGFWRAFGPVPEERVEIKNDADGGGRARKKTRQILGLAAKTGLSEA